MTKTILVSGTTLIVGFLVGAATGALLAKKQPREKEYVEVIREVPAVATAVPETPPRTEPKLEPVPSISWRPKPGERCTMTIRTKYLEEYGLEGKQWVIPTDILALERFVKYIEARDRDGLLELLKANRAVWTDQQVLKDVLFIADGPVNWVANVRLGVGAYKPTEEDGWMRKKNYLRATAVEAVVPLHWLSKGE